MFEFFNKKQLSKQTKLDLKKSNKEKRRCAKLYSDWKDDEYNCGPLKFLWGVKSIDDSSNKAVSTLTLNDLEIFYNRDTHKYLLVLETSHIFNSSDEKINYLDELNSKLEFYIKNGGVFDYKFDPYFLYLYSDGNLFVADTLTELYYKFKLFVFGLKNL